MFERAVSILDRSGAISEQGLWAPESALVARCTQEQRVCGLVVRIAGFHPAGPGSIPGSRMFLMALWHSMHPRGLGAEMTSIPG